ncbi:MAG: serine/threonine-protein kinase [Planctomycetota bacterium]
MTSNEDFLFAQEAVAAGFVTDAQVKEALELQRRMADDLHLDERLSVLLVKRGYLAEEQARRVYAKLQPDKGGPGQIHGYRLLEVLGRGAMGTVYRALHLGLNREVAVKILRPDLAGDRTQVERLKAEAAMLASLDHPNIVRALDAGESNGFPYVVMELVEGETLRDRLRREGRLPEDEALRITRGLADALERARRMGVVHRDVKPGNILMSRSGQPKLMDLGLAKGPIDLGLTQHGATVGTPQYISPEQALDPRKADTRSDIYSLGATLYAMLAGQPPFDGATLAEILTKVLYEVPVPVRSLRPEVSPETGYLVERMMLRDAALRYRTPAQVVADIDRLTQGASILPPGFTGNWEAFLLRKQVRKTTLLVATGVAAGLLVAGGWKLVTDWRQDRRQEAEFQRMWEFDRQHPNPLSTPDDVEREVSRKELVLAEAKRVGAPQVAELRLELQRLREEQARCVELRRLLDGTVAGLEKDGQHAAAQAALRAFYEKSKGVAKQAAGERLGHIVAASDAALDLEARRRFPSTPRDVDDLASRAEDWATKVAGAYARSGAQALAAELAERASVAAQRIRAKVVEMAAEASDEVVARGVEGLRFAETIRVVERAREVAVATAVELGEPLTVGDPYVVGAALLTKLASDPFEQRRRELDDRVGAMAVAVRDDAYERWKRGDVDGALTALATFEEAAGKETAHGAAYPQLALDARQLHDEITNATQTARNAARRALDALASDVIAAVQRGDLAAADALLAQAAADAERLRPVAAGVAELARVPDALRGVETGAVNALPARRGRDERSWLPTLRFVDGAEPEPRVEILAVDPRARTFDYQTHRGGGTQVPTKGRPVASIADDDLLALAGLDATGTDAAWLRGVLALRRFAPAKDDLYGPIAALDEVLAQFRAAGVEAASPLAAWAAADRERRVALAERSEAEAAQRLATGRRAMAAGEYGAAFYQFRALVDPSVDAGSLLTRTKEAAKAEAYVREQLRVIEQVVKVGTLQLFWPSAKISAVNPGTDALDVEAVFGFEDDTPLKASFLAGWARVEVAPSSADRVVTPGEKPPRALRLLPGAGRETVADRPLVLASPFVANAPRSLEFRYFAESPFALAIDLDGVQVAILSDDPQLYPFPPDVPRLPDEAAPPKYDVYGHGRGIRFRAATELTDPARWGWDDLHQGRHFVPPNVNSPTVKRELSGRAFAFRAQERPYRVRLTWHPERGAELYVDDELRASDRSEAVRAARPSGRLQVLLLTSGVIDDLKVRGRVDEAWLAAHRPAPPTGAK